jgi:hypothetical protein
MSSDPPCGSVTSRTGLTQRRHRRCVRDSMNLYELRTLLRRRCDEAGSVRVWALKHGVSPVYVGHVLAGKRGPGKALLDALGLVRVISYTEKK